MTASAEGAEPSSTTAQSEGELVVARGHTRFAQTKIVSDLRGARVQDSTLLNAWGLAFNPSGIAWVSANGADQVNIYDANGKMLHAPVKVAAPTGQVFNADASAFGGDLFIIAGEDGIIAGWKMSDAGAATTRADLSSRKAVLKGLTISSFEGAPRLYVTDFHNGTIDVFDATYAPISTGGGFKDPTMPRGFNPFNVQALNGVLVVTYAKLGPEGEDDEKGPGNGFVDLFDTDGHFLTRLASRDGLNSPWGVAMTPYDLSTMPGRLLIGNFGDGTISQFNIDTSSGVMRAIPEGHLRDLSGGLLRIDGLWALQYGPGSGRFDSHLLYFTAGPNDESNGVFGSLKAIAP